jgi:hypothetical protein
MQRFATLGNECGKNGRPGLLNDEEIEMIVNWVNSRDVRAGYLTPLDILQKLADEARKFLEHDALTQILRRDGRIRLVEAKPMEEDRMNVTDDQIMSYLDELRTTIDGTRAHFLFNMDEVGHQDWADRGEYHCYVAEHVHDEFVYVPVPRTGKRITVIACVAADGSYLRPSVIISRKTFEDEIVEYGLTPEKVEIYDQPKGFIDTDIFEDWIKDTFVPEVERRRTALNCNDVAYLILDNCSSHKGANFQAMCRDHRIAPIFIPPHSSHLVQPLDLCLFGLMKQRVAQINKAQSCNVQTQHIVRVVNAFQSAATTCNVIATFRNAGISLMQRRDERSMSTYPVCIVSPVTMRCWHADRKKRLDELTSVLNHDDDNEDLDYEPDPIDETRRQMTQLEIENELQEEVDVMVDMEFDGIDMFDIRHSAWAHMVESVLYQEVAQ